MDQSPIARLAPCGSLPKRTAARCPQPAPTETEAIPMLESAPPIDSSPPVGLPLTAAIRSGAEARGMTWSRRRALPAAQRLRSVVNGWHRRHFGPEHRAYRCLCRTLQHGSEAEIFRALCNWIVHLPQGSDRRGTGRIRRPLRCGRTTRGGSDAGRTPVRPRQPPWYHQRDHARARHLAQPSNGYRIARSSNHAIKPISDAAGEQLRAKRSCPAKLGGTQPPNT